MMQEDSVNLLVPLGERNRIFTVKEEEAEGSSDG